jgi:hypothetical protein
MKRLHLASIIGLVFGMLTMAMPAQAGTIVYSNITNGPATAFSQVPGTEIGDELLMTAGGILDSVDFSVYNSNSSEGPLDTADLTFKFYNYDTGTSNFVLAGTLSYSDWYLDLWEGEYLTLSLANISGSQTIPLTNDVLVTLTISDLTGGATKVGQIVMGPPTVGSSADNFFMNGDWYWFGGTPVANFYWQIDVNPATVPEPSTMLLLGSGLLGLAGYGKKKFFKK